VYYYREITCNLITYFDHVLILQVSFLYTFPDLLNKKSNDLLTQSMLGEIHVSRLFISLCEHSDAHVTFNPYTSQYTVLPFTVTNA
jgi:hypothetical protein